MPCNSGSENGDSICTNDDTARELVAARARKSQLQRLLGKKTMENEVLKEAVDIAREKKWLLRSPLFTRDEQ